MATVGGEASSWQRREDPRLLSGAGCFVGDINVPGMLHAVFVRSAYAHARVLAVLADEARAMPGVRAVLTAADFAGLRQPQVNAVLPALHLPDGPLMPMGHVQAVGAPLALVLASTCQQAQAAADRVWIEVEEQAPVPDFAGPGAADLHPGVPGNQVASAVFGNGTMPAHAPTAQVSVALPRVAANPLEPRAALMQWDSSTQRLQTWLSTQTPARARVDLAQALGLALDAVRVIAPDVGGAFGGKASIHPEDLLLAWAARLLGATLRWQASRSEDLLAAPQGRASRAAGSIWLDSQGVFAALTAEFQFSLGHWLTYSALVPARNAARIVPGPYRVAQCVARSSAHLSTAAAVGIYRGAGRPEAAILLERLVEEAAAQAGIDPLLLRQRNVWAADELPRTLDSGEWLDRCNLPALLAHAAELFDYTGQRLQQAERRSGGELVGIGIALYVEPCGQGSESVQLTALADGRFGLATGATAQGQGRETSFAGIAARVLGCNPDLITVLHGDTRHCPPGVGALASRSTAIGGSAVQQAALALRAQMTAGAALPITMSELYTAPHEAWSSGCVMLALVIARDTGQLTINKLVWVDDAGVVLNPLLVEGQLWGGLAQGLGQALMERVVYDDQGQLLTGSLMDYALPRASDMPPVRLASLPTPSAANALGAKGVGEAGCIGVPAALLNAVADALRPLGIAPPDFPLSPERLWRALQRNNAVSKD